MLKAVLSLAHSRAVNVLHLLAVASEKGVPAHDGDLLQHLHAVLEVAHAGALVVSPAYRHFLDAVTALERDEENLGVEAPTLNRLQLEDGLRGGTGKCFEAALGIGKVQPHHEPSNGIETAPEELAIKGLAMGLPSSVEPARADGDIGPVGYGGEEAFSFFHRRREIGVGKHRHFSQCLKHPGADAVTLAAIAGILDEPDFRSIGSKVAHHLCR